MSDQDNAKLQMDQIANSLRLEFERKLEDMRSEQKREFDTKLQDMKSEQKREFDTKLQDMKSEQKREFDAKLEEQQREIYDMKAVVDHLTDSRLMCWNVGVASSRGSTGISIRQQRSEYIRKVNKCMCCGGNGAQYAAGHTGLTTAHILPFINNADELFGTKQSYIDDVDLECEHNYLVLCGTQRQAGSCHNAYDNLQISLYFNSDMKCYNWIADNGSNEFIQPDGSIIYLSNLIPLAEIGEKYVRLLNWRTLRTIVQPGVKFVGTVADRSDFIDKLKYWEQEERDD